MNSLIAMLRLLAAALLPGLFFSTALAQQEIPLWGNDDAGVRPSHSETTEDKHKNGRLDRWISYVSQPTLTIYPANKQKADGPAVLVIPGGGFRYVCIDKEGIEPARWLNSLGITAVVLKYRTLDPSAKRTADAIEALYADPIRAMRMLRYRAAEWHINPQQIGVMGFSAGGAMAIRLTMTANAAPGTTADPIEKTSYRPDFVTLVYAAVPPRLGRPANGLPPFFVVSAADDPTVPVAVVPDIFQYVQDGGGSIELHVFRRGGHGFGVMPPAGPVRAWTDLDAAWMRDLGLISE
jgi:acetyl esterase/lipase